MLMAPLTRAELNLLQERRQELGLNAQPALVPQMRSLLGKGMGSGSAGACCWSSGRLVDLARRSATG